MNISIKTHYSASELVAMHLPDFPSTRVAIRSRADREAWPFVEIKGIGGTRREYSPPAQVLDTIRVQAARNLIAPAKPDRSLLVKDSRQLQMLETDAQRLKTDARKGILTALDRLMAQCHVSREAAMVTLLTQAKIGQLDDHLAMMLRAARDERGRKGDGFPSIRTLKRWLGQAKTGTLTPKTVKVEMAVPAWAKDFLAIYQRPQKPSVELAFREFTKYWIGEIPTIHQVRRFLGKLGKVSREVGRMGPRELKNIRPFIRRTFDQLHPNDVWSADGHTFDAEVQHPMHGRPFRPEITSIIDIATRRTVGFSVGLAESSLAVLEAISYASNQCGVPAIFYVDNGSGYNNQLLKAEGTGLKGLLGFEVAHSLPYNSQAKGVIERAHQSIWIQGAQLLDSFVGASMDREARLANFKVTRKALKQGGAMPLIGWDMFLDYCRTRVAEYNGKPHRALPKISDPVTGKSRHMSPDEALATHRAHGWEPVELSDAETQNVFRPRIERTVQRGEVSIFSQRYFSALLEEFHGERVHVAYDIHDGQQVWIHHLDGRLICKAEFGANHRHYFPMSRIEQARENRADARVKRLEVHLEEVEAERRGHRAFDMPETIVIPGIVGQIDRATLDMGAALVVESENVVQMPESPNQRFDRWMTLDETANQGGALSGEDLKFYTQYQKGNEWKAFMRQKEETGELQLSGVQ